MCHIFLARVVCKLFLQRENETVPEHRPLLERGSVLILEILAETLAGEDKLRATIRQALGESTELVPLICQKLAEISDDLSERNNGRKSRDVSVTESEKVLLTALVRVLGNLVFQCTNNH